MIRSWSDQIDAEPHGFSLLPRDDFHLSIIYILSLTIDPSLLFITILSRLSLIKLFCTLFDQLHPLVGSHLYSELVVHKYLSRV